MPIEAVRYVQADTGQVKSGAGHGGARSMHMGGAAVVKAIDATLAKARTLAAHLLQASEGELVFAGGGFAVQGSDRAIALPALARSAEDPANLPDGMTKGLGVHVMNMTDVFTFPSGCHVAEVEVDPETGAVTLVRYTAVDDYGRLINPLLTEGQVQGGVAQGIGQAMAVVVISDTHRCQDSMQPARGAAGRMNADGVLAIVNFCIFPIQRCNESFARQSLATAARGKSLKHSND